MSLFTFPTLASGASIARGSPPRQIGQKPESTIRRRTAHKSLPPGGRGTAIAVEGACGTLSSRALYCNALSLSRLRRQPLPEGAFRKFTSIEKHHQRKFLGGVRVFSAKVAEASRCFFYYFTSSEPVVISLPDERLNIIISSPVISKRTF